MHTQPLQTMIKNQIKRGRFRREINSTTVMKPKIHMKFLIISSILNIKCQIWSYNRYCNSEKGVGVIIKSVVCTTQRIQKYSKTWWLYHCRYTYKLMIHVPSVQQWRLDAEGGLSYWKDSVQMLPPHGPAKKQKVRRYRRWNINNNTNKKKKEIPNPQTSITFPLEHCGFINFPSEIWFVQENGLSLSYNNIIFNILITQTIHSSLLYEKKINSLFIPSTGSQYISLF